MQRLFDVWSLVVQTCFALLLTGCVVVPVPTEMADPEPFTPAALAPIRVGQTTREEIRALFADWTVATDDGAQTNHLEPHPSDGGRYWTFGLPRQTSDVALVGCVLLFPGLACNRLNEAKNHDNQWVLVEFNDDDTVGAFWIVGDKTPCAAGGVCYSNGFLQVMADDAANAAARADAGTDARCVLYAYAERDFDMPVSVGSGDRSCALLAQTTFVRIDVSLESATVPASLMTAPGIGTELPIACADATAYYVALRQHEGSIDGVAAAAPDGERAVAERLLIERLVPVVLSVDPVRRSNSWTNCTLERPCQDAVVLDARGKDRVLSIVDESGHAHSAGSGAPLEPYFVLRPGRYTVSTQSANASYFRDDTFDLAPAQRYRLMSEWCSLFDRSPHCKEGRLITMWLEDTVSGRVVAGEKWCAASVECPESSCSIRAGSSLGICAVPELKCAEGVAPIFDGFQHTVPRCKPAGTN